MAQPPSPEAALDAVELWRGRVAGSAAQILQALKTLTSAGVSVSARTLQREINEAQECEAARVLAEADEQQRFTPF